MKVIDTHVHFWELENKINSWVLKESNPILQKNYLPENLINNSTNKLLGVVHIEAHDSAIPTIREVEWLKQRMQNQKIQYKHIAFADLTLPQAEFKKIIDQLKQYDEVAGVRHILSYNPKFSYSPKDADLSSNNNIAYNLEYLAENNFIFDCQVYPAQIKNLLPAIIRSNVITVIDHILLPAWNQYDDEDCRLWQQAIAEIAKYENIYMKLSGLDMFQNKVNFDFVVKYCLDKFSKNRLVYGSNYPVSCTDDYNGWADYLGKFDLSVLEKEQIFYKNAMKLFKLED